MVKSEINLDDAFVSRNKDFVKTIFKPKSKYLGEEIPLTGNGDITNDK